MARGATAALLLWSEAFEVPAALLLASAEVASRNLLEGILTVRRRAFFDSSADSESSRSTVTEAPDAVRRARVDVGRLA